MASNNSKTPSDSEIVSDSGKALSSAPASGNPEDAPSGEKLTSAAPASSGAPSGENLSSTAPYSDRRPLAKVTRYGVCSPRFNFVNIGCLGCLGCLGGGKKEKKDKKPDSKDDAEEPLLSTAVMKVDGVQPKEKWEKIKLEIFSYSTGKSPKNRGGTEICPSMFFDPEKNLFTVQGKVDMKLLAKTLSEKLKVKVEIVVVPPKDYEYQYPCRREHSEPSEADTPYVPPS